MSRRPWPPDYSPLLTFNDSTSCVVPIVRGLLFRFGTVPAACLWQATRGPVQHDLLQRTVN
ncbi:MAG: hypothetical protein OJF47_003971 [Nitrospira sp.]|nr:MAG: hypothetical protein OJF47_003971 [Nitrospira sp.]